MPVAAAMRHKMFPAALATLIAVTAQRRGAALLDRRQDFPLIPGQLIRAPE
jgi:hypothetical protein